MGQGGTVTLINGTPYNWTLTGQNSYQMSAWNWPAYVEPGAALPVYIEWEEAWNKATGDDAGDAYYTVQGSDTFHILGRASSGFDISITFDNLESSGNTKGSTIDLGWSWNGNLNFILSGDAEKYSSSNPPIDWMHQSLDTLGNRRLRHICMPGSHDAGMSELGTDTAFATKENTLTQQLDIYNQLLAGSRYFDIRPVISGGGFYTGHYSFIPHIDWQGGNGQSIADIVDDINRFTDQYAEFIILDLSHAYDTDNSYTDFTQDQWSALFSQLSGINALFSGKLQDGDEQDLSQWPLSNFISDGPCVLVYAELSTGFTAPRSAGIFYGGNLPTYNSYADSNSPSDMAADQLQKLASERNVNPNASPDVGGLKDGFFVLSWTLTQQTEDVLNPTDSIRDLAVSAYPSLFQDAWPAFTPWMYPNVLFMDLFGLASDPNLLGGIVVDGSHVTRDVAALAMAVNDLAGTNSYVASGGVARRRRGWAGSRIFHF